MIVTTNLLDPEELRAQIGRDRLADHRDVVQIPIMGRDPADRSVGSGSRRLTRITAAVDSQSWRPSGATKARARSPISLPRRRT